jgi:adenine-specific DNA-methyltransferase
VGEHVTELNFKGKEFVYNHHLAVPFHPLVPDPAKGIGPVSFDGNLIVQGDNLRALKALLPLYAGVVDCIFIDPPYNTGNEGWRYNDNVNAPMIRDWLESNPIGIDDGLRHDKWCAMMWPRLRLLHSLLKDGGFFFASIDHNEVHNFRSILDEIFGEGAFVANIAWQKRTSPEARKRLGPAFDTILVFRKLGEQFELNKLSRSDEQEAEFSNPDNDPNGPWVSSDITGQNPDPTKRKDQQYKIQLGNGEWVDPPRGRCWGMLEPEFLRLKEQGRIWFGVNGDARPRVKTYLNESEGISSWTWWPNNEVGHNQEAKKEIQNILDEESFDYPKPVRLLRRIIDLALSKDGLILDSFAGSGTTAHAVLEANKLDGGNRRFILVEMEDYADRLTAERVRRVINGYDFKGTQRTELLRERLNWRALTSAVEIVQKVAAIETLHGHEYDRIKKEVSDAELVVTGEKTVDERAEGLGGTFTYCTLGDPVELDKVLSGETLPSFAGLGAPLFHMATNQAIDPTATREADFYPGATESQHVWLIYKPDLEWLKSPDAALTLARAKAFAATDPEKKHLVFAPARFVSQKMLAEQNIPLEFVPLPFALYRIDRS